MVTNNNNDDPKSSNPVLDQWFPPFTPVADGRAQTSAPVESLPVVDLASDDDTSPEPASVPSPSVAAAADSNDVSVDDSGAAWLREAMQYTQDQAAADPPSLAAASASPSQRLRGRAAVIGAAAAVAVFVIGGGAIAASALGGGDDDAPMNVAEIAPATTSTATTSQTPTSSVPQSWCSPSPEAGVVRGSGPGGTGSGPDAILAFDHAYYVERSGAKARALLVSDAQVKSATAEELQAGIDTIPAGTEHCVEIRPTEPNTFAVTLEQRYLDGSRVSGRQIVKVTDVGGRTLITSIGKAS
ncbi:hypothetical protein LRL17_30330 (plasmid) [Rhodococcus qingshengii]|uniref:hypothetical protein n=1 Tax=Rhodococcus qingshengii TaxID=334542 RepID=UPI001E5241EF|nr:hypothetical protein [Rhodococcus qingshengii]UGQ55200.1 hypothetical protein LRL17_30330 [Rhodococcus qingshengii]